MLQSNSNKALSGPLSVFPSGGYAAGAGSDLELPTTWKTMWTKTALHSLIESQLRDTRFIVVSNREPYMHRMKGGRPVYISPASGMVTALDPIMRASGGTWVAHGSGDADRLVVDKNDHVRVPFADPSYTLRRVWLDPELENGYYLGLSNEGLWPLCHISFRRPVFRRSDWEAYKQVNQIFADVVLEEAGNDPAFVFIQDYHFGLLPRMLKTRNPKLIVGQFWHIPWPNREAFRVFPWHDELLDGLLGNDLLGFHVRYHCANFLDAVNDGLEARVDTEQSEVYRGGRCTMVRPFPISIDFEQHQLDAATPEVDREIDRWYEKIGYKPDFIGIGIDRMDYTKGIPERLRAIDVLLENHPEFRKKLVFVQIAVPSRSEIEQYALLNSEVDAQIKALNDKWRDGSWEPVCFQKAHHGQIELMALHRMADFCIVSSLHDGMNLVAKEFAASRFDERGVLILSKFTGAARELKNALLINPFATDDVADAIAEALVMPPEEQNRRMQRLRQTLAENNIYRWAGKFISALLKIELPERKEEENFEYESAGND